jgi:hypothetical protein
MIPLDRKQSSVRSFKVEGIVEAVLTASNYDSHISVEQEKLRVVVAGGVRGDRHYGEPRQLDVRERDLVNEGLPKGLVIANVREVSVVSVEEQEAIARGIGLPEIPQGYFGENLVLRGIPNLTLLPPGTKLFFKRKGTIKTAVLAVWAENDPCEIIGDALQERFPDVPNLSPRLVKEAVGKRGVVAFVYSSGIIHRGDTVIARVPLQRPYTLS